MTVLLDARPPGVDALFRPGSPFTAELTWPVGELAGRTFTATLDGAALDLAIDGDVMTITASAAQTTAAAAPAAMVLTEHVPGDDPTVIVGKWAPSNSAAASRSMSVAVTVGSAAVEVTVAPVAAAQSSREIDVAEITANVTGLAVNGLSIVPVPGLVVTVPDLSRPVWINAKLWIESNAANSNVGTLIAAVGSTIIGQQIDAGMAVLGAAGTEAGPVAWARLPANSPGDYQAFVFGSAAATLTVIANAASKGRIAVLEV